MESTVVGYFAMRKPFAGSKDVTEEMEETGQIEGLEGDEPEDSGGAAKDNERPIEMEEDFPEVRHRISWLMRRIDTNFEE